jgi:D-3-phosphoglycerate dehydrogenase / 2-oxoglutarate reductase
MKKLLITDDVHPILIDRFTSAGYLCDYQPNTIDASVRKIINQYEGLIINSKILVNKDMIDKAPLLQFVGRLGSGMEIVDIPYAESKGVKIVSSPEGNCNAVAEHALGMLLALANNLVRSDNEIRKKVWNREANRGFELAGKTVGIIGFGHTGSAFTQKLSGMDVKVLVYDKYGNCGDLEKDSRHNTFQTRMMDAPQNCQEVSYQKLINESDIISFHLPLAADTIHFANAAFFNSLTKKAIIINTSRGKVINTPDLISAMTSGKITHACLDVFENEKTNTYTPQDLELYEKLYSMPNTILSPHIAGWTVESKKRLAEILCGKIIGD